MSIQEPPVIIDSSAYISLASVTDSNHELSLTIKNKIKALDKIIILPGEIFTEIINVSGKKLGQSQALAFGEHLLDAKEFSLVETISTIRENALIKFKIQAASVSFTDCLVMAFADEFLTKEIFGFDEVFRKNGYVRFGID